MGCDEIVLEADGSVVALFNCVALFKSLVRVAVTDFTSIETVETGFDDLVVGDVVAYVTVDTDKIDVENVGDEVLAVGENVVSKLDVTSIVLAILVVTIPEEIKLENVVSAEIEV
ncbi:hypothetical protein HDU99_006980, partial [Rhizoclosmatium hyalinum]